MTERRPRDVPIESWAERQIRDAEAKGAFRDLPGLGKPIPGAGRRHDESAWLRGYLARENVSSDALLPTPLRLRREKEKLPAELAGLDSEDEVRGRIADLNRRIADWLRAPMNGPQIAIGAVDADAEVERWRAARLAARPPARLAPEVSPHPGVAPGSRWSVREWLQRRRTHRDEH